MDLMSGENSRLSPPFASLSQPAFPSTPEGLSLTLRPLHFISYKPTHVLRDLLVLELKSDPRRIRDIVTFKQDCFEFSRRNWARFGFDEVLLAMNNPGSASIILDGLVAHFQESLIVKAVLAGSFVAPVLETHTLRLRMQISPCSPRPTSLSSPSMCFFSQLESIYSTDPEWSSLPLSTCRRERVALVTAPSLPCLGLNCSETSFGSPFDAGPAMHKGVMGVPRL